MKTLMLITYRDRLRRGLLYSFGAVAVIALGVAFLLPGRPLWSALVGVAAAGVIFGSSAISISKMVDSVDLGIGWLALDYLVKIAAIAGSVLLAKYWSVLDPLVVAGIVIAAVVVSLVMQLLAIQKKQSAE